MQADGRLGIPWGIVWLLVGNGLQAYDLALFQCGGRSRCQSEVDATPLLLVVEEARVVATSIRVGRSGEGGCGHGGGSC